MSKETKQSIGQASGSHGQIARQMDKRTSQMASMGPDEMKQFVGRVWSAHSTVELRRWVGREDLSSVCVKKYEKRNK